VADPFLLLILSSPSGAGKTTLTRMLREKFPTLRFSVSHTTRKARVNESDGKDYHFIDRERFDELVERDAFLEWAHVHENCYGTSLAEIERAKAEPGCSGIIFDIDYQGARQIKAAVPGAVGVFILPPSLQELERRLRGRGTEDEQTTRRRLHNAKGEIEQYGIFDYVIVNDEINRAYEQLRGVVYAERCRRPRLAGLCEQMLIEGKVKA
jgi:guanylate kinase